MNDWPTYSVVYMTKIARVMMLWISLFMVEKVFQDSYIQRVMVNDEKPPQLLLMPVMALGIEMVFVILVYMVLALLRLRYKRLDNTFIIDGALMNTFLVDYMLSMPLLITSGLLMAHVVQNGRMLRYHHDGLRGIRALGIMLLCVWAIILTVPLFPVY